MRLFIFFILLLSVSASQAQRFLPGSFIDNGYRGGFANNINLNDSTANKKWSLSKYSGISTSFTFFKGGNATVVSAPLGLQLNRRLNNNLYAFAGVSVAPSYINFNQSFMTSDFNKANQNNPFFKSSSLGIYSRAELGLQYVNDEKTFSISGSIGVERSSYPMPIYSQINSTRSNPVISANR
ncbi:hypothetical protein [Segetibacter aerophilus]|uniref:hypothetical protein n=1 Tax=Segetibacter aerophilus TaxID=670293 RepID=UPI0011BDCEAB|nr:hypothetical protein [Segetibacter aerophilus]